jgi:hypothetical protein
MRVAVGAAVVAFAVGAFGCGGSLEALGKDVPTPTNVTFVGQIQADLMTKGCLAVGACHGAPTNNPMPVTPNATAPADLTANYNQVRMKSNNGAQSLLLTEVLQGSGATHPVSVFPNTNDPTYQRWLAWITAGAPQGP